ncbi:MAG TPA: hypothetical protein VKK79_19135 [Candidatus Lokiarchaeia archaeon]|nr:hypothetical protein [Candidatus Lokiarchaeia archaeon]
MDDVETEELFNKLKRATMLCEKAERRALDPEEATELKALERELLADTITDARNAENF